MITKEILASFLPYVNSHNITSAVKVSAELDVGKKNLDMLELLMNNLMNLGLAEDEKYLWVDMDTPASGIFVGRYFGFELYELFNEFLHGEYELYKIGNRLCLNLYKVGSRGNHRLQHFELYKFTPNGYELYKDNEVSNSISHTEMVLLFCKSPLLTTFPFTK